MKAMIRAQQHDIDVLNLSLGGGPRDRVVEEAITDARLNGMLVVVAAGNNGRQPVSYPAAYRGATAVSAMGRSNCFPAGSWDEADVSRPPDNAHDPDDFIAAFSNVGPQIACTGLGVAVLSTLPNNSFGPMSGTSMAAPMVAGCAASLLSQRPATYNMPRDQARSDAIEKLLQASCATRFNDPDYEGYGLPDPAKV
jgi:subtilisin